MKGIVTLSIPKVCTSSAIVRMKAIIKIDITFSSTPKTKINKYDRITVVIKKDKLPPKDFFCPKNINSLYLQLKCSDVAAT